MRPVLNLQSARGRRELREIAEAALGLVLSLGGAMSGEHGDGLSRGEFLEKIYGAEINAAFRLLKNAADPQGLLNPGKIVSPPPMDANLRYDADYRARPFTLAPVLDFSAQGGLVNAIEQCNGAGVCRKFDGTMCPSFQATREESHATRGRANLLRAMISGRKIDAEGAAGQSLEEAVANSLDLCLACKGCKSECPSGVDMAKIKYEFFNHYYQSHTRKWRDYLFGYIGVFARLGAPFGKVINWGLGNRVLGGWVKRIFGIAPKRALPKFGNRESGVGNGELGRPFDHPTKRLSDHSTDSSSALRSAQSLSDHSTTRPSDQKTKRPSDQETILYLPDAFTRYFEPEIEQAALTILRAAGLHVIVLPVLGAGRTLISKSFLDAAKKHAQAVRDAIRQVDAEGRYPVVGAEPSEIYTLKDEYLDFFPNDAAMQSLAARSYLIDEFLLRPSADAESPLMRIARLIKQKREKNHFAENSTQNQNRTSAQSAPSADTPNRTPAQSAPSADTPNRTSARSASSADNASADNADEPNKKEKISLHGHCYQKARPPADDGLPVGQDATAEMLRAVGYEVEIIPSGCCGMAGAFGYEQEHYDLSMQVGELVLFPAIRQEQAERGSVSVCAPGASCREQIAEGTGVTAQHPLVWVARSLW